MSESKYPSSPLEPMDAQYIQRLVTLENKMDYLIEQGRGTAAAGKGVEERVEGLERRQQWVIGASAALMFVSGALGISVRLQVRDLIRAELKEVNFLEEACRDIRSSPKPPGYVYPPSCQL